MTTSESQQAWIERLKFYAQGLTPKQIIKVGEYVKWIKVQKVLDDYDELFRTLKKG